MKKTILMDKVDLKVYREMNYASACEDCTHFDKIPELCTFGFPTAPHLKRNQIESLAATGTMAFCRAIEID
jgi:hypothetical protein